MPTASSSTGCLCLCARAALGRVARFRRSFASRPRRVCIVGRARLVGRAGRLFARLRAARCQLRASRRGQNTTERGRIGESEQNREGAPNLFPSLSSARFALNDSAVLRLAVSLCAVDDNFAASGFFWQASEAANTIRLIALFTGRSLAAVLSARAILSDRIETAASGAAQESSSSFVTAAPEPTER